MAEVLLSLLSGLVGAAITAIAAILYTEHRDKRENQLFLARERLEKVYGPLMALRKKVDLTHASKGAFLLASNTAEKEMLENIIFHRYHLIDEDLKEGLVLLHPELSKQTDKMVKIVQLDVDDKIIKHYEENKKVLGLR